MTQAHTPGPWHAELCHKLKGAKILTGPQIYGPDEKFVAKAIGRLADEADANARLIAAAPELLAALEDALDNLLVADPAREYRNIDAAIRKARAAIAKARGE